MLVAFMILLCNHKGMEFGKLHAYLGPMCASENCQWRGEPYFAGAAISISGILPQIPKQDKHKSFKVTLRPPISRQSVLVSGAHLGSATNFSISLKFS
jgi:hypothetical protein